MRLFVHFGETARNRANLLSPPFDLATIFGPYCACDGQVYQPGITIDPDDSTALATVGEVYAMGAIAGQLACECEDA